MCKELQKFAAPVNKSFCREHYHLFTFEFHYLDLGTQGRVESLVNCLGQRTLSGVEITAFDATDRALSLGRLRIAEKTQGIVTKMGLRETRTGKEKGFGQGRK